MISANCKRRSNGLPILSAKDIDNDAERLIRDYDATLLEKPTEIPIEAFVEGYQGLTIDYQYLSNCGLYLGMMIFNDSNKIVVYNPDKNRAEYINACAGTVIIDNSLLGLGQEHRYRFTLAHEGPGHGFYHFPHSKIDDNQYTLLEFGVDIEQQSEVRCRMVDTQNHEPKRLKTKDEWMEWQANKMAAAFLMPRSTVEMVVKKFCSDKELIDGISDKNRIYILARMLSDTYNVSPETAFYRLKGLNHIADKEMRYNYSGYLFSVF